MNKLSMFGLALAMSAIGYDVLVAQSAAPVPTAPPKSSVQVVSPCDNLDEGICGRTDGCTWLPGYKVPGGQDVAAYCRPAPKPLSARRSTGPAPVAPTPAPK